MSRGGNPVNNMFYLRRSYGVDYIVANAISGHSEDGEWWILALLVARPYVAMSLKLNSFRWKIPGLITPGTERIGQPMCLPTGNGE